jgi:hypothetical protein
MQRLIQKTFALGVTIALPLTSLLWATPSSASRYRREFNAREFYQCAAELQFAGISEQQTQTACAMALEPTDLSECVLRIDEYVEDQYIQSDQALFSCFRVRRPVELATCVVEINEEILEPKNNADLALNTMDHCRRSLLPLRFSACVRGLSRENYPSVFEPKEALDTCIDAEDFPRDIYTPATNSTGGRGL